MTEPKTWEDLRQLWTALGYGQLTFSHAARDRFPGMKRLSQPSISKQLTDDRYAPVPEALAKWALTLTPLSGAERGHEYFCRAKASSPTAAAATPPASQGEAAPTAPALVAQAGPPLQAATPPEGVVQLPPDQLADVAKRMVTEMIVQLPKPADPSEVVKQVVTEMIAQLPKPTDSSEVARKAASEAVAQQPKPPDSSEVAKQVVRSLRPYFALMGVLLLTGLIGLAVHGRPATEVPSMPTAPVIVNVGTGLLHDASAQRLAPKADNASYLFGARPLEAGQMGEKGPDERYIPKTPLRGQKLAPYCEPEAGESTINGACWVSTRNKQPPCGRFLFRSGNECYAPVAADPNVPVSSQPE